jgi:exodeoxyribonuclease VII large subunit
MEAAPESAARVGRDIYSVSRLNREVRVLLERGFGILWVEAEISNFSRPGSGHWYFSLKDANAQVRCAMFRQRNIQCAFTARDGQKVLVRARIGLYEPRGEFQLIVEHMEDAGLGALKRQFEELAAKLKSEGLFAAERKRPLPALPRRVGVITSPSGAAVRDILHVLARRFPAVAVMIYPVAVQGAQAPAEIIAALGVACRRAECDVLILARGGGSLEDLWAFNDERLARAIVASSIPVVSGVGHEIDFTIADFAADMRAPTPSAAAELVVPDAGEWLASLASLAARLARCARRRLGEQREQLRRLERRAALVSPAARCAQQTQRLDELEQRLRRAVSRALEGRFERLRWLQRRAGLASPSARVHRHLSALADMEQRLYRCLRHAQNGRVARFRGFQSRFWQASPLARVRDAAARHAALEARLQAAGLESVGRSRERLLPLLRTLHAVSPLATLARGYAIVKNERGEIVRNAEDAPAGTLIEARLAHGHIRAKVQDS